MTGFLADIHTHVLPGMDDGSSSVEESVRMLRTLSGQGITAVAATPHFYPDREDPASFLERRNHSLSLMEGKIPPGMKLFPGAEVCYYPGIRFTEELPSFTFGKEDLLLLEMPFHDWQSSYIKEVFAVGRDRGVRVVIAHADRYLSRNNDRLIKEMSGEGVLFQINANALLDRSRRAAALKLLKNGTVSFVASDCHNMGSRIPKLDEAFSVIGKKLGDDALRRLSECAERYLEGSG